jgi:hypothetical protein
LWSEELEGRAFYATFDSGLAFTLITISP